MTATYTKTEYIRVADTAKLVRKALAAQFPGVKFSVRSDSYSGGASIDVRWEDGPTDRQVRAITGRFTGASFDGTRDLKSYHTQDLDGRSVRFAADFIFTERRYSDAFLRSVAERTAKRWGVAAPPVTCSEAWGARVVDDREMIGGGNSSIAELVRQDAARTFILNRLRCMEKGA